MTSMDAMIAEEFFYVNPGDMIEGQVSCPYCLSPMTSFEGKATITSADFTERIIASLLGPVTRILLTESHGESPGVNSEDEAERRASDGL